MNRRSLIVRLILVAALVAAIVSLALHREDRANPLQANRWRV